LKRDDPDWEVLKALTDEEFERASEKLPQKGGAPGERRWDL
jgi:hypothetical protein